MRTDKYVRCSQKSLGDAPLLQQEFIPFIAPDSGQALIATTLYSQAENVEIFARNEYRSTVWQTGKCIAEMAGAFSEVDGLPFVRLILDTSVLLGSDWAASDEIWHSAVPKGVVLPRSLAPRLFILQTNEVKAFGYFKGDSFWVKKGSTALSRPNSQLPVDVKRARKHLRAHSILVECVDNSNLVFTEDVKFRHRGEALNTPCGTSFNGHYRMSC